MNHRLRHRLQRLETADRPTGLRIEVVVDEAHATRVELEHLATGDPRRLITVRTGVPRNPEGP